MPKKPQQKRPIKNSATKKPAAPKGLPVRLVIAEEITADTAARVLTTVANASWRAPMIVVDICSMGGDVEAGFAIYDSLRSFPGQIVTCIWGRCFSIATLILQAGDVRYAAPNSRILVHNAALSGGDRGVNLRDIELMRRGLADMESTYVRRMAERTQQSTETIRSWMKDVTTFTPDRALQNGLIDQIIGESTHETRSK